MSFISMLPRKRVGRLIGALAGWEGSSLISRLVARTFASVYGFNMAEAEFPLEHYPNLATLFTRRLKPGARPIDPDPRAVVSPVDGIVAEWGPINGAECTQVKGKTYSVDELLGGPERGRAYHGGFFITIYLSPRHYHRIHSPVAGEVRRFHHLPGQLWPVNGPSVRSVDRLFAVNERLVTYVRTPRPGRPEVAVVKVAAIGVGRITVPYADIITNEYNQVGGEVLLANPYRVDKGGEVGTFNLGSTVVLVFPPNMIQPQVPAPGQEIQLGHRLALLLDGPASP